MPAKSVKELDTEWKRLNAQRIELEKLVKAKQAAGDKLGEILSLNTKARNKRVICVSLFFCPSYLLLVAYLLYVSAGRERARKEMNSRCGFIP
jgi:hypothetical protein